jgi:uncharacterized protein (UPF0179 family)
MELDRRHSARARKSGERVPPLEQTCQNFRGFWVHQSGTEENSCLLNKEVVANVSVDVTLIEEILDSNKIKTGQRVQVMIISRAFVNKQVFDQMLGG